MIAGVCVDVFRVCNVESQTRKLANQRFAVLENFQANCSILASGKPLMYRGDASQARVPTFLARLPPATEPVHFICARTHAAVAESSGVDDAVQRFVIADD